MLKPINQAGLVPGLRSRPDAADEDLLDPCKVFKASEEQGVQPNCWWSKVVSAAQSFGARSDLPSLAPLRCYEALEISKLSRLLDVDHLADTGQKYVSVAEFLRLLGCPDAARMAQQEVQEIAQEALKSGIFEGKVLQLHHLRIFQWAGATWTLPDGRNALHILCLAASRRTWMGGGSIPEIPGFVAPLRGAAWGAKARYLMHRVPKWYASLDHQGCTPLNYLMAPLKSSDCMGTVDFEMAHTLLSRMSKIYETSEMQVEASRALMSMSNGFGYTLAVMHGQNVSSMLMPNNEASLLPLQQSPQEQLGEDLLDQVFAEQVVSQPFCIPAVTILEPLGCALAECRRNLYQAHAVLRRALAPQAQLRLLQRSSNLFEGESQPSQPEKLPEPKANAAIMEERKDAWEKRREEFERRLARLEMELHHTAALPPVVSSAKSGKYKDKEQGTQQQCVAQEDLPSGRKEAKALIMQLREQRILEAAPSDLEKNIEQAKVSLSAAVDRLARDLYDLEGHFVFELVQNADDNYYDSEEPELCLSLHQNGKEQFFLSRNNEKGLRERDVVAMCDINASSKRSGCIGKKGIGWKSTFAVSNCPHVLSGCFTFKFDVAGPLGKLGYVTPTWLSDKELCELPIPVQDAHRQGGTVIYLPLFSGFSGIQEAFDHLLQHHVTLLFLKRICRISLGYPDGRNTMIQRDVVSEHDQFVYKTDIVDDDDCANGLNEIDECFHYALHPFRVPDHDVKSALGHVEEITLRLAFPLDKNPQDLSIMALHVGLPVRAIGFYFAVDAPFDLVASRRDLHEGSAVNHLICDAIPLAFREFIASAPSGMSAIATKLLGADVVPRPIWLHLRDKLLESLNQVACVLTECGEVCPPSSCLQRPHHPLALRASELIPAELLKSSCSRRFTAESQSFTTMETLSLKHWVKILSYRGGDWPKGLVAEATSWENPCDFFLPFCRWLEMELKESEQPSEILQQIWDVDLLPAFRSSQPLRLSSGHLFARPCLKIRTDWQGVLCEARLLRIVEPRVRVALQNVTPYLLESLTMSAPTRAQLAQCCLKLHLADFDPLLISEPLSVKAVLASLACLKESFLAEDILDGLEAANWKELGKRLWIPSCFKRVTLQRPMQLCSPSFLGVVVNSPGGTVAPEIARREWGEDLLAWEAFFDEIGVEPLMLCKNLDIVTELGQRLCTRQWWSNVGAPVMSYVQKRCEKEANYLAAVPVMVNLSGGGKERHRKICLRDHFLHEVYHRLGGPHLHYIQLPEKLHVAPEAVETCLKHMGVQVQLTAHGLVKCLKMLRVNGCANTEVFADVYKEIVSFSISPEQRESLREMIFVAGGFKKLEECTWDEDSAIQWLTKVPSLKVSYQRYGPRLQQYFLEVLEIPEVHPGFLPSCLLTALKNLVQHVETAMSKNRKENLPGTPTTAGQLLDSMKDLAAQIYGALAQVCRKSSMTWHADVRRAFVQERLLLLPPLSPSTAPAGNAVGNGRNGSTQSRPSSRPGNSEQAQMTQIQVSRSRPKRLFAKEAWWDVETDLADSKAADLSLRPLYENVPDAEFLFLRVLGIRKRCSRADIAHRLKASMSCPGPLSNWAEGIHITDIEELENIQTSSFFRPPDWRAPDERQADEASEAPEAPRPQPPPPPPRQAAPAPQPAPPARQAAIPQSAPRPQQPRQPQQAQQPQQPRPHVATATVPERTDGLPRCRFAWREARQEPPERPRQKLTWSQLRAQQDRGTGGTSDSGTSFYTAAIRTHASDASLRMGFVQNAGVRRDQRCRCFACAHRSLTTHSTAEAWTG